MFCFLAPSLYLEGVVCACQAWREIYELKDFYGWRLYKYKPGKKPKDGFYDNIAAVPGILIKKR